MAVDRVAFSGSHTLRLFLRLMSTSGGFVGLYVCSLAIVKSGSTISLADLAYWLVVGVMMASMLAAMALAPPATRANASSYVRRYLVLLALASSVVWLIVHGLRALLR